MFFSKVPLEELKSLGIETIDDIDLIDLLSHAKDICENVGTDSAVYADRDADQNCYHNNYKIAAIYIGLAISLLK